MELQFLFTGTMLKSTRSKWSGCSTSGQSAWNDPGQLSLKVLMALTYMAGLVAFQRYTGLLNPSVHTSSSALSGKTEKFSSQDALYWLKHYHPETQGYALKQLSTTTNYLPITQYEL